MDALFLSRIQFGLTIAFHYIFPPMNIGLGVLIVIMEGMYLKTGLEIYHRMTKFWVRIFALIFAIGVATGIVMEFQFGTNWATYSRYVGDVFGSALAAEGIFAFFLESGFLGVLLFGWDRVGKRMHFVSAVLVCLGAHFSAIWIVVANSWMQTPAGHHIVAEGLFQRAEIIDFWGMVFNPSSVVRVLHVYMGCWQSGAWFVASVSAFYLLINKHRDFALRCLKIALIVALFSSLGQLVTGHKSAEVVAEHQPAKLAAYEGHFKTKEKASVYLFGWPDEKNEVVHYGIKIPGFLGVLLGKGPDAEIPGLDSFDKKDQPPVFIAFQAYHGMLLIGIFLIILSFYGVFLMIRKKLEGSRWFLKLLVLSVLGPHLANQLGWIAAEVGRQPWIVYNLLRTSESFSKNVPAAHVLTSLIMFAMIYALLFALFIYLLHQKIVHGPEEHGHDGETQRAEL